jgi:hypothetical protein
MQAIRTLNLKTAAQLDQTSELTRPSNGVDG